MIPTRRLARLGALGFVGVVAAGVVLRFATRSDLWLDEALTVNIARMPVGDIAHWLHFHDGAPPLHYWLLHGWMVMFGATDLGARSLSGVLAVATLPLAWWCGVRVGGRAAGWACVVLLALNPFAIRYATEARMYGLEIFLIFAGILCVRRAIDRPSLARLAPVALISAALLWSQYWCLSLVGTAGLALLLLAWRSDDRDIRRAALRTFAAVALGALTFAFWIPAFLFQAQHTGTPWADAQLPPGPIFSSFFEFAGGNHSEGWLLVYPAVLLALVGAFGKSVGHLSIELDLTAPLTVRWEAFCGIVALSVGATLAYLGGSGFQPRYAAIALPFFVIVMARGAVVFTDPRVRAAALAFLCLAGLAGGIRNVRENRTQAAAVAAAIAGSARPGDVVAYCPDQLGPATSRVLRSDVAQLAYPFDLPYSDNPKLVDWQDYKDRLASTTPQAAARRLLQRAAGHDIFLVTAGGYITHDAICPEFLDTLIRVGHRVQRQLVVPNPRTFERSGLSQLSVR